ncbi:hypothetical protein HK405_003058 [Cladochytrium tenue]|nr:hypothetical protein HK405_003058 [Cladochytrium tenue]
MAGVGTRAVLSTVVTVGAAVLMHMAVARGWLPQQAAASKAPVANNAANRELLELKLAPIANELGVAPNVPLGATSRAPVANNAANRDQLELELALIANELGVVPNVLLGELATDMRRRWLLAHPDNDRGDGA